MMPCGLPAKKRQRLLPTHECRRSHSVALLTCSLLSLLAPTASRSEGLIDSVVQRFAQSDFQFLRARSNAPFLPLAWVTLTGYEEGAFTTPSGSQSAVTFQQQSISEAAFAPIPLGQRDSLVVGEWLSLTHFDLNHANADELDVFSASIPVGWIRQSTPDWQVAAFVAPLGHKTHQDDWYWETLGGVFGRYTSSDRVAWIFGAYADVSPLEDFYTPYIGATFILNERWSINAVMPWPAVTYAPSVDTVFRLGVVPSGSSWSIEPGERRPRMSLTAWDFGFSIQQRLYKYVWVGVEVGVSGLRGLSIVGGDWQGAETKLDNTGFALLTINLRPN
jgi:hypothetical protein